MTDGYQRKDGGVTEVIWWMMRGLESCRYFFDVRLNCGVALTAAALTGTATSDRH